MSASVQFDWPEPATIDRWAIQGAEFSDCGQYRYTLTRIFGHEGILIGYFGVNPSKASAVKEDQTSRKWRGFARVLGARGYVAGNPFAYAATNVNELSSVLDPVGPANDVMIGRIIDKVDLLVPCWGSRTKLPQHLWPRLDALRDRLFASGKPVKVFGLTKTGDPMHPLTLSYDTKLIDWEKPR